MTDHRPVVFHTSFGSHVADILFAGREYSLDFVDGKFRATEFEFMDGWSNEETAIEFICEWLINHE